MKNKQEVFNSEKISPGHHGQECPGNGEFPGIECCCDECDFYLECFCDWEKYRDKPSGGAKKIKDFYC